ncbi:hypothetical protein HHL22_00955 [Hymenobacter sp. RP-2-7]|uniref:Uncharacterized protein n=1 Tax=Hymenobacter polaris TaxID=2682546 RepID=A0A7Y0FKP6_9BACT|nr:hypothetical protein [Hymenobacter polaris]NML63765.1 hypothetical protein [Hymenobacter polaris]
MRRSALLLSSGLLLLTAACQRADPAPLGGVKVTVTYTFPYDTYALYTEVGWAGPNRAAPLQENKFNLTGTAGSLRKSVIEVNDLNPGNYVITLLSSAKSVQVTAGRQNEYTWNL